MRKNLGWPLLLVGIVAVLVAVNLSLREDPEPDLGTYEPPAPRPESSTITVPHPEDLEGQVPREPLTEEGLDDTQDSVAGDACAHAFVPSERGQWRRYRWTQSDQERTALLRIQAGGAREAGDDVQVLWDARVVAEDDDAELAQANLVTRCTPGGAAEEPWFGILERALGLRLTAQRGRWRWPEQLTVGTRFAGTATFDPRRAEMRPPDGVTEPGFLRVTRRHRVIRREPVEVPAGRFDAWRVEYEEQQEFQGHGETGTGTVWVTESVGLVKSDAQNSVGVRQTIVLEELGSAQDAEGEAEGDDAPPGPDDEGG